jgi:hypothetical protein
VKNAKEQKSKQGIGGNHNKGTFEDMNIYNMITHQPSEKREKN